jgi:hydrogenase maturation protein HypF
LPGSERAIRQPRRTALAVLAMAFGAEAVLKNAGILRHLGLTVEDATVLLAMIDRRVATTWTSSVGRLFDAAAALVLGLGAVSYEGEAAIRLESVADPSVTEGYPIDRLEAPEEGRPFPIARVERGDWRPMIVALVADVEAGVPAAISAARFHNALARWAANVAAEQPGLDVVLGGGCFQNRLLTTATLRELGPTSRAFGPGTIPPGDGGLAAGQLAVALGQWAAQTRSKKGY